MTDDADRLLFTVSHGEEEPERATVPFIAAATATVSGHLPLVIATVEGVTLGLPEVAERVADDALPPLRDLQEQLHRGGGELWLCSACTTKRGITGDDQLVPGATIVGAARIVEALATGRSLSLG